MGAKIKKYLFVILSSFLCILLTLGSIVYFLLMGSLPQLSGTYHLPLLEDEVRIDRDVRGIPSIYASSHIDAARALGYLHAQDRYFQMDLMRRAAAGELSELFGSKTLQFDKKPSSYDHTNTRF
jgi:penicillin G amidase